MRGKIRKPNPWVSEGKTEKGSEEKKKQEYYLFGIKGRKY